MKSFKFLFLGLMSLSIVLVGCKDDDPPKPVSYVEDGFYVVGEATAVADLFADNAELALMAVGLNENSKPQQHQPRTGMYEKYVALEGGKTFQLMLKAGANETPYGATLTSETLSGGDQPPISVQKGTLTENGAAMQVSANGLYHIVVDVPLNKVIIAPVQWGVRGAMNSWGFTPFPAPTFNKESMKYTLNDVTVEIGGGFKFAYGNGWKIEIDGEDVKVNTNLGNDGGNNDAPITPKLTPGGPNIGIQRAVWKIELTWTLAKGAVKEGYTATLTQTSELEPLPEYPDNLYINGSFVSEDWDWSNDNVITMVPVHSHPYAFWAITYFDAGTEFKFAPGKAWAGDFGKTGDATDGVYEKGGDNISVATAGYYLIYVDLKELNEEKIFVGEPSVYLMGDCAFIEEGDDEHGWHEGRDENKFAVDATGLTATTYGAGNLRMYAACPFEIAGWWQMEFNIFDGEIVYRATGDDQDAVPAGAGKTVTLDFKAGTGTIEE